MTHSTKIFSIYPRSIIGSKEDDIITIYIPCHNKYVLASHTRVTFSKQNFNFIKNPDHEVIFANNNEINNKVRHNNLLLKRWESREKKTVFSNRLGLKYQTYYLANGGQKRACTRVFKTGTPDAIHNANDKLAAARRSHFLFVKSQVFDKKIHHLKYRSQDTIPDASKYNFVILSYHAEFKRIGKKQLYRQVKAANTAEHSNEEHYSIQVRRIVNSAYERLELEKCQKKEQLAKEFGTSNKRFYQRQAEIRDLTTYTGTFNKGVKNSQIQFNHTVHENYYDDIIPTYSDTSDDSKVLETRQRKRNSNDNKNLDSLRSRVKHTRPASPSAKATTPRSNKLIDRLF
ncbi:hypothetical protein C1646_762718 [Rhizophagus diaphanus]|nr:hypothetical protein C1646_762718 [Rhizophagus diaphanus] [Rhizophagus sp. MUCL 43196]